MGERRKRTSSILRPFFFAEEGKISDRRSSCSSYQQFCEEWGHCESEQNRHTADKTGGFIHPHTIIWFSCFIPSSFFPLYRFCRRSSHPSFLSRCQFIFLTMRSSGLTLLLLIFIVLGIFCLSRAQECSLVSQMKMDAIDRRLVQLPLYLVLTRIFLHPFPSASFPTRPYPYTESTYSKILPRSTTEIELLVPLVPLILPPDFIPLFLPFFFSHADRVSSLCRIRG